LPITTTLRPPPPPPPPPPPLYTPQVRPRQKTSALNLCFIISSESIIKPPPTSLGVQIQRARSLACPNNVHARSTYVHTYNEIYIMNTLILYTFRAYTLPSSRCAFKQITLPITLIRVTILMISLALRLPIHSAPYQKQWPR